jgi:hypothetical protein
MRSTKNRPTIDRSIAIDAMDMPALGHNTIFVLRATYTQCLQKLFGESLAVNI